MSDNPIKVFFENDDGTVEDGGIAELRKDPPVSWDFTYKDGHLDVTLDISEDGWIAIPQPDTQDEVEKFLRDDPGRIELGDVCGSFTNYGMVQFRQLKRNRHQRRRDKKLVSGRKLIH